MNIYNIIKNESLQGEPRPAIQWWREDYEFRGGELKQLISNETYKIKDLSPLRKDAVLQVGR